MIRRVKLQNHNYICQNCGHTIIKQPKGVQGGSRRCPECRSNNLLRDDHPLLHFGEKL